MSEKSEISEMSGPAEQRLIAEDIEAYLARHEKKELVRFVAVGSVDDGKSTLIGRLLHDTKGVYEDQLAAVKRATKGTGEDGEIDFSLFTDGLTAEREQGITIDVAYRYFSTERRKFIIADTPGHVQYTRNMATGASTADVAIILLDARLGVLPQSRRHGYIASLLGIRHLLVAVNKMDLVDWDQSVFDRLSGEFGSFARGLSFEQVAFFPISAKKGDNVAHRSTRMPWWGGGTLLEWLETVPVQYDRSEEALRFPVQSVIRPHLDYRGFAGQIASGVLREGDELVVLPSLVRAKVKAIDTWEGPLAEAQAPLSVTVRLDREVDVSRGDLLARPDALPRTTKRFESMLVWLSERPFDPRRQLVLKHTSRQTPARIEAVAWKMDLEELAQKPSAGLSLNDIARVTVRTTREIFCDPYGQNRVTGAFILVDALANDTVAAGMIVEDSSPEAGGQSRGPVTPVTPVTIEELEARMGQRGAALWLSEADAQIGEEVERALFDRGFTTMFIDGTALSVEVLAEVVARAAANGLCVIATGSDAAKAVVEKRLGPSLLDGAGIGGETESDAVERTDSLADALARAASLN